MTDTQDQGISSYNEASLQILRLHDIWSKVENHINKGELEAWRWQLDSVWRELYADVLRMKDSDGIIKKNKTYRKHIAQANNEALLYELLNMRHQFLKYLQDRSGKGAKYVDTDEGDFD